MNAKMPELKKAFEVAGFEDVKTAQGLLPGRRRCSSASLDYSARFP
jgi:hypothetical protein